MKEIQSYEPLWGEWRVVNLLGKGAYGTVYLAEKVEFSERYYSAIKHIALPSDKKEIDELYTEGLAYDEPSVRSYYNQIVTSLKDEININYKLKGHTNIVSYEDHKIVERSDEPGFDLFIRMEYLTSLTDYIRKNKMTVRDIVRLGIDVCSALLVLWREKTVHRDIKPANIFVNEGGDFKLGDFGVARTLEKTSGGMSAKGTFAFMAPELLHGAEADYRVDIYSLGLLLYRFLNGNRAPFLLPPPASVGHNDNERAQARRLKGEELPPPAFADERLWAIVRKACEYDPQSRWQSAEEMRGALVGYLEALPSEEGRRVVLEQQPERTVSGSYGKLIGTELNTALLDASAILNEEDKTAVLLEREMPKPEPPDNQKIEPSPPEESKVELPELPLPAPIQVKNRRPLVVGVIAAAAVLIIGGSFVLVLSRAPSQVPAPETTESFAVAAETTDRMEPVARLPEVTPDEVRAIGARTVPDDIAEPDEPIEEPPPLPEPSTTPSPSPKPSTSPLPMPKTSPSPTPSPPPEPSPSSTPSMQSTIAVTGISLSRGADILEVGATIVLTATVMPANATYQTLKWSTSNPGVATVDAFGNVKVVGPGSAVITVSCESHQATYAISVN